MRLALYLYNLFLTPTFVSFPTHYHSCTFQYTKGFEELCNRKISTQDEREEGHNLTPWTLSPTKKKNLTPWRRHILNNTSHLHYARANNTMNHSHEVLPYSVTSGSAFNAFDKLQGAKSDAEPLLTEYGSTS